jgi:hypothetical protein
MLLATILVLFTPSIYSANAQSDTETPHDKILQFDDSLTPTISVTLTALSLTGASFLVAITRGNEEDTSLSHIRRARISFIKAFFMFLLCTVFLFIFDFIEILSEKNIVLSTILDVIITYVLFGLGLVYLVNAAKQLYRTYGKTL